LLLFPVLCRTPPLSFLLCAMSAHNQAMEADREAEKSQFLQNTFWCYSCLCYGCGLQGLQPLVHGKQKFLCMRSEVTSGEECVGDLGLVSSLSKIMCCIHMAEFPPDPLLCGACNFFCIGTPPREPTRGVSAEQFEQMQFMANTFWLYYCCCTGYGFASCGDPLVKGQSKICCCRQNVETDDMCGSPGTTESCCYQYSKFLCLSQYQQCLPAMENTPGCGVCGVMCCMKKFGEAREPVIGAPEQTEMADRDV